jgi:hypothetical protein
MSRPEPFEDVGFERIDDEQVHGRWEVAGPARAGRVPEFNDVNDCK